MIPKKDSSYHRPTKLAWSGFDTYRRCPLAYKKRYVDREKVQINAYNALGGKVIQRVFELFYNDEIWRRGEETKKTLEDLLVQEYSRLCATETIDWDAPESKLGQQELLESLQPLVGTTLSAIKEYRLLGKYARSEVKLQAWLDNIQVNGVADFVIRRGDEHLIMDGKLTRHRNKYLKVDQLIWYVMLFYMAHQVLVDRVGWIYYTYGEVEWVPITIEDVKRLHGELRLTLERLKKNDFEATPSDNACRFCDYKKTCLEGQAMERASKIKAADRQQKAYEESGSPLAATFTGDEEIGF